MVGGTRATVVGITRARTAPLPSPPLGVPTFNPWTDQPIETAACARLPDVTSLGAVLVKLDPASTDPALVPTLILAFPGFEFSLAKSVMSIGATPVTNSSRAALGSAIRNRAFKLPITIRTPRSQAWRRCCGAVVKIRTRHSRGSTGIGHADGLPGAKWLESLANNAQREPTGLDKPRAILSTC